MQITYRAPENIEELNDSIYCSMCAFDWSEEGFSDDHFFSRIVKFDPWYNLSNTRACFVNGQVASVVVIFERPIRIGNTVVKMGGLGSVGTHPDHRKKGYSSQVLLDTVNYLETSSFDLSLLFTGINEHYAKAGWVTYPVTFRSIDLPKLPILKPAIEVSIERYKAKANLPAVMEIYDQFNQNRTGTTVRNLTYWHNQPKWRGQAPDLFWVARKEGRIVAYLKGGSKDILEIGYQPNTKTGETALNQLVQHFLQNRMEIGQETIRVEDYMEIQKTLEQLGIPSSTDIQNHFMFRITNFRSLLVKLVPMLENRLRKSDLSTWQGEIRLQYELDVQTLIISDGKIKIRPRTDTPNIDLQLSQLEILRLIFGELNTSSPSTAYPILSTLFPPDQLLHWPTDNF